MSDADLLEAVRLMGRNSRWYSRHVARELGLKLLPGAEMTVNGTARRIPAEDVTQWEPGEREYVDLLREGKGVQG